MIRKAELADASEIAKVHVACWQFTYKGIVDDTFLSSLRYEDREIRWRRTLRQGDPDENSRIVYVVENADQAIVGFAMGGPHRDPDVLYTGELYAIYLLPDQQKEGLGRRLVKQIAHDLAEQNHQSMIVWALSANPACAFYERLGGVLIRSKEAEIGLQRLPEQAYGWRDVTFQILSYS